MSILKLSAALMTVSLLSTAPALAQSTQADKQKTQEVPSSPSPAGGAFNADPNYKQRTQEVPSSPSPAGGAFNADPNYKQRTQEVPSSPSPAGGAFNADPNYKQR